ncbi:MAG: CDP-glycerol glycerophosphotransferase family protein, partial [Nanoarchaeota archaeon]|nr:CDP-glycerol glycerophosphotransferase family protein [Nanoarchaeota archaeon]
MRIKTTIKYLLLHIIYFFVRFVPRNRKIWIFGSRGESFSGNSKWLFLYLHDSHGSDKAGIRKIWISRSKKIVEILKTKGFEAYYLNSLKGHYYAIRGGIYFLNVHTHYDISYFLSNGAKKINLWHGITIAKKIGLDSDLTNNYFYKLYRGNLRQKVHYHFFSPWEYEKYDMMVCTSEMTKKYMKSAFGDKAKDVIITGFPRNDVLLKNISSPFEEDQKLIEYFDTIKSKGQKIILYMPTYRDNKIHKSESINIPIDWEKLNSFLIKNNSIFMLKLHPVERLTLQISASYKNIRVLNNSIDIYPVLKYVDILITDYSSICYDFLLCPKPIIFYWYDLEEYKTEHRSLYDDFETLLPGPTIKTSDDLLNILG